MTVERYDSQKFAAGMWVIGEKEGGRFVRYDDYAALKAKLDALVADREMLKRLAVILSGSDAPGEIKALTVTAQSFVDRCKLLAKERDALQAEKAAAKPIAWESTTPVFIHFVTDERYRRFTPGFQRWYKPYLCSRCRGAAVDITEEK